jgi:hypothetical protein
VGPVCEMLVVDKEPVDTLLEEITVGVLLGGAEV